MPPASTVYTIPNITKVLADNPPETEPSAKAQRNAAVAMVIRETPSAGLEALFIKRAEHPNDPWSGHMAFPGGRAEPEDESLEGAACRETLEEVGLRLEPSMKIGRLNDLVGARLSVYKLSVTPFVFHHADPPPLILNDEVDDTVWVPLEYMSDPANVRTYFYELDPQHREFPSFQYEGYTIWGLTYRILTDFFALFDVDLPGEKEITDVE